MGSSLAKIGGSVLKAAPLGMAASSLFGGGSKKPGIPDSRALAIETANANKYNTSSVYGSGNWVLRPGADPNNPQAGDWTQQTTLSAGQQGLYDQGVANRMATALAGNQMAGDLGDRSSVADALYGRATQYMDQQFGDQEAALNTQLQNQGLTQGSAAYDKAMRNFMQTRGQAYEGAANSAVINADTAQNNATQRMAQILAMTREATPQGPGIGGGPDLLGAAQGQYRDQLGQYNADQAKKSNDMNSMMQMGLTAAMMFSDRRLKSNISVVGVKSGLPVYEYDIGGRRERGFMADEVQLVQPAAVAEHSSGYLMVNYDMLGGRP